MQNIARRDFLTQTAALAGVTVAIGQSWLCSAGEQPMDDTPIIDTHQHLWDLGVVRLPWLSGASHINRDFVTKDYLEASHGLNVVKTVYMEVDVDPEDHVKEAEYVLGLCKDDANPMAAAVIGGRPASKEFAKYIERYAGNKYIKGVRQILHVDSTPQGFCLQPQFIAGVQLLGELGMSFDICVRPGEVLDAVELVDKCPKTRFVIDHCGNMPVADYDKTLHERWMKGMREMAQRDHTVCKISGIVVTAREDWKPADLEAHTTFCMETFGEDRAYFAGDWPVCTLRASFAQWVNALKWIVRDRTPEFRRKLFHDNAARFYGLA